MEEGQAVAVVLVNLHCAVALDLTYRLDTDVVVVDSENHKLQ
jgi:hypothetical protein